MEAPIKYAHFHIFYRITGKYTRSHGAFKPFLDGRYKFTGDRTAEKIIDELVMSFPFLQKFRISGSQFKYYISKLSTSARLLN